MEAKNAAGYDLPKAQQELDIARANREASVGVFVFSKGVSCRAAVSWPRCCLLFVSFLYI